MESVAVHGIPAILNSDQDCHFTSIEYKMTSKNLQIRQSMEGKNRWQYHDWTLLNTGSKVKNKLIYITEYRTPRELRKPINDYVSIYNKERPHEPLDYAVPDAVYYGIFVTWMVAVGRRLSHTFENESRCFPLTYSQRCEE